MVTRGVDGLAKLGGMGPQIAALVRHSEEVIKVTNAFSCCRTGCLAYGVWPGEIFWQTFLRSDDNLKNVHGHNVRQGGIQERSS